MDTDGLAWLAGVIGGVAETLMAIGQMDTDVRPIIGGISGIFDALMLVGDEIRI